MDRAAKGSGNRAMKRRRQRLRDEMGEEERKHRAISQMLQRSADSWVTLPRKKSWKESFFKKRTQIRVFPQSLSFVFCVKHPF